MHWRCFVLASDTLGGSLGLGAVRKVLGTFSRRLRTIHNVTKPAFTVQADALTAEVEEEPGIAELHANAK